MNSRIATLYSQPQKLFHTNDLAVLWNIQKPQTLYTTIMRYKQQGLLHTLQKGLYSSVQPEKLDPAALGIAVLHTYAYISFETVLFNGGIINQLPNALTLASSVSRRFTLAGHQFRSRKIHDEYLHSTVGIMQENGILIATPERAICDLLYLQPLAHFDAPIDWAAVRNMQKAIGYPLTNRI